MLYMNYPRCVFSASFVKECTDVSYVAGEGVGLTVHKKSVVIEEIEEVELISPGGGGTLGISGWGCAAGTLEP